MRPSQPGGAGVPYTGHLAHPHQLQYSGPTQAHPTQTQYFPGRGPSAGQLPNKLPGGQGVKYFPSLSGSETDVSTSTENLTQEERYVLRNMERQEPQGEENHHQAQHYGPPLYQGYPGQPAYHPPPPYNDRIVAQQLVSNNARREALRLETMIAASRQGTPVSTPAPGQGGLHRLGPEDMYAARMATATRAPSQGPEDMYAARMATATRALHQSQASGAVTPSAAFHAATPMATAQDHSLSRLAPSVYSHPNVQDPILQSPKSFYKDPSVLMPKKGFKQSSSGAYFDTSAISRHTSSDLQAQNDIIAQLTREMKMSGGLSGGSDVESSGSTSTLNNPAATAEKIAALALQAKLNSTITNTNNLASGVPKSSPSHHNHGIEQVPNKPPPPYQSPHKQEDGRSKGLGSVTSSPRKTSLTQKPESLPLLSMTHPVQEPADSKALGSPDQPQYSQEMIDIITGENRELKNLVDQNKRRISKLDTLEKEMMKIHEAYQALKEHSEKRELLEKSARAKLQGEIAQLAQMNKELNDRHEYIIQQMMSGEAGNIPGLDSILRGEIMRKDALVTQLLNQNKECMMAKDRVEQDSGSLRETLAEQRAHIDVLDSALSQAQDTVLRLEEEVRQKEVYVDRVKSMTKSLEQLQVASEKREGMEKKLRQKLEEEVEQLRREREGERQEQGVDIQQLARQMAEQELIRLESERTQWEQRYLEESAMRQVAIDAASLPKDAKIAILEKTGADAEKKLSDARSEKLKMQSEMQQNHRRLTDMDLKVKSLESAVAEKNSMIKVLQTRSFGPPFSSEAEMNVLSIPVHDSLTSSQAPMIMHSKQLSQSALPSHASHHTSQHAPQLSNPAPLSLAPTSPSRLPPSNDFFDGISSSMSSTARGPLTKLSLHRGEERRVRSGSPGVRHRSATPQELRDLLERRPGTPTSLRELGAGPAPLREQQGTPTSHMREFHQGSAPPTALREFQGTPTPHLRELASAPPTSLRELQATPTSHLRELAAGGGIPRELQGPVSMRELQGPNSMRELQGPASMRELQGPISMRELQGPNSMRDLQGPTSMRELQGPSSLRELQGPTPLREVQGPATSLRELGGPFPGRRGSAGRRDSAPGGQEGGAHHSPCKTLINTSDLYTTASAVDSGATLPKMSFAPMKEEMSRTLPTKGFHLAEAAARHEQEERREQGDERRREGRQDRNDQSNMSLDSSLTLMDDMSVNSSILNRSSLLEALRNEKESRPDSYWRV